MVGWKSGLGGKPMQNDFDPGALVRRSKCVRLIVDVRRAYRQFAQLMQQHDSPGARAALLRVTRRLSLMNRALAVAALESAQVTMAGTDSPA